MSVMSDLTTKDCFLMEKIIIHIYYLPSQKRKEKKNKNTSKQKSCEKSEAESQRQDSKLELVKMRETGFLQVET